MLVDFAMSNDRGLAVVIGEHGMGKSHMMAAVGVTLEQEMTGDAVVCPAHICGTHLWHTFVAHICCTFVAHICGTHLLHTFVFSLSPKLPFSFGAVTLKAFRFRMSF